MIVDRHQLVDCQKWVVHNFCKTLFAKLSFQSITLPPQMTITAEWTRRLKIRTKMFWKRRIWEMANGFITNWQWPMAMTNHYENHIGLSNITEKKWNWVGLKDNRIAHIWVRILTMFVLHQYYYQCYQYYYQCYQHYYQRRQNTKELMAIAALTQSFTARHFRDKSNESHG